jgi:outer membrane receptor protein involved in Fe transport
MFAIYEREHWRFQINVENITNEWYVGGATAQQFMRSGPPRYGKLSVAYTF